MAEILWSRPICKVAGDYLAWPTVVTCASREVLVVFSGDREEHVCPYGKTLLIRSGDGGETWTTPAIINNTPLDDRDAGIIELASGALVMSWFTGATWDHFDLFLELGLGTPAQVDAWARHCRKIPEETRRTWLGSWTRRSTDGGRTWEPPVPSIVSAPHGPVQAAGGELLYVGTAEVDGRGAVLLATSTDEARSWQVAGTVLYLDDYPGEHHRFTEPHVAELAGGELLCILRTDNGAAGIHSCRSSDRGCTWSPPEPTGMDGHNQPGHLVRLADGRLLCTYGRPAPAVRPARLPVGGRGPDLAHGHRGRAARRRRRHGSGLPGERGGFPRRGAHGLLSGGSPWREGVHQRHPVEPGRFLT